MAKRQGAHPKEELNAARVRALKEPGRYPDGNGLYLVVDPSGAKRWLLRTMVQGRRRDIGLGGLSVVPLAKAREQAREYRAIARDGGDPLVIKRAKERKVPSFEEAAREVYEGRRASFRNAKHQAQWITSLETYVFPAFGSMPVDRIGSPDILKPLGDIWLTKHETARRVKQRVKVVFDWCKASGFITGENPVEGVDRGLPRVNEPQKHHEAMAMDDVPAFIHRLRASERMAAAVRLAFEFLILTATRSGETMGAKWEEIELEAAIWIIPGTRTKTKRDQRVPLCARAVAILEEARALDVASPYVFPGQKHGKPISNMSFTQALRRMDLTVKAHGFRSSFRDWASERTGFPNEVCEMALGHAVRNKVEAAYRRGDLFEKRRDLMEAWASFVQAESGKVVSFQKRSQ